MLPTDYRLIVTRGTRALREVEAQLRARAESTVESNAVWLRVRDVVTLAESEDDWTWQTGFAFVRSSPCDLSVLEEAIAEAKDSPYDDVPAISALMAFVARYQQGGFTFEDARTFPQSPRAPVRY